MNKRSVLSVALIFLLIPGAVKGQKYRMEAGIVSGSSFYMGDANNDRLFDETHAMWGVLARYCLNDRTALKANVFTAGVSGTTQGEAAAYKNGGDVRFNRRLVDAGLQFELNFYHFGAPEYKPGSSRVSPYLLVGLGMTGYEAEKKKIVVNVPLGLGVKMKLLPRVNLGCEWTFRRTGSDDLDYAVSPSGFQLEDSWAGSRNKNKDWYSVCMFYIGCDLFGIGSKCYR